LQINTSITKHEIIFLKKIKVKKIRGTLTSSNPVVALTYSWWREEITKANKERRNMRIA